MDVRWLSNTHSIHGCKDSQRTNTHGCKGSQVFHSWKMNKFYEPVQQNDFKGQLTNPGKLTYMDVKELTYRDRRRPGVPLLPNNRSKVKFQEAVHENEPDIHDQQRLRMSQYCVYMLLMYVQIRGACARKWLSHVSVARLNIKQKIIKIIR